MDPDPDKPHLDPQPCLNFFFVQQKNYDTGIIALNIWTVEREGMDI